MPAPIKLQSRTTGNLRGMLAAFVSLTVLFIGIMVLSFSSLPVKKEPAVSVPAINAPQVQGDVTENEYITPSDAQPQNTPTDDATSKSYDVTSVSDGDTIKVRIDDKIETVRLIGVDTPETKDPRKPVQCYGQQASDFTKNSLLSTKVTLATDDSQQNRDKYGRLLRYVYMNDGTLFNQLLVASGYAYEYTYKVPYQFQEEFRNAQEEAKLNKLGLWNDAACSGMR